MIALNQKEVKKIIKETLREDRDIPYVKILEEYYVLTDAELYVVVGADGKKYNMIQIFMTHNGETNSVECNLIVWPDTLKQILKEGGK